MFVVGYALLLRQRYGKHRTESRRTLNVNLSLAEIYDALYQRQTETVSLRGPGRVALIELFENMLSCIFIHPVPVIDDLDRNLVFAFPYPDLNDAANRGVFYGVVDQIEPYLIKQILVPEKKALFKINVKFDFFFCPLVFKQNYYIMLFFI